jgi:imidazolonepropionase-like amidohydrolase
MHRIEAEILIPGRGDPIERGCVILDEGTIVYAGTASGAPRTPEATVTETPVVMPGMWECHGHFMGLKTANVERIVVLPSALAAARATADAVAALRAGFTSVREAGGLGVLLARAIDEGSIPGPTVYAPGAILSTTGGHGDVHPFPVEWIHEYSARGGVLHLCDGVPDCLRAVRMQLRLGARVIKVCATGGVLSELDDPLHQQFSDEELAAIVAEAARAERVVMAHCHGKAGIMAALRAGCHTIEHGTYLDEEAAARMVAQGAMLVPTRFIVVRGLELGEAHEMPAYAYRKLVIASERHEDAVRIAHAAGVRIALGTDIATSGADTMVPWGMNAHELPLLTAAGLSPLEAIEAATANGPATLGPQAPRSGVLAEGYDADVLAVAADPLQDVEVLTEPANITTVWKSGVVVKDEPR